MTAQTLMTIDPDTTTESTPPAWASTATGVTFIPDAPGWADTLGIVVTRLHPDPAGVVLLQLADPADEQPRAVALTPADARRLAAELERLAVEAERPLVVRPHPVGRPRLAREAPTFHPSTHLLET